MTGLMDQIMALARLTLNDPRRGLRVLLSMDVPLPARTVGLLLVAVCSALLVHLGFLLLPATDDPISQFMSQSPFSTAVVQWLILVTIVLCVYQVGRVFGGKGTLTDTLLAVVWLHVIMLAVQIAQLLALVLVAPVAGLVNLAGLVLFFWLFTSFIAELHGFSSRWAVLAGVLGSGFVMAFLLVVVLSIVFGPEVFQGV